MNFLFSTISCFLAIQIHFPAAALQCKDENGDALDWYVLYKLPRLKYHQNPRIASGIAYAFITPETTKQGWQLSNLSIMDQKSFPGQTLSPLFSGENHNEVNDKFSIFYNDQPPYEPFTEKDGHTKGVVAGDREDGFWLVHSVPHFPFANETTYKYPLTGRLYGQSFLCISMNSSTLDTVGGQLITNCAHVFHSSFTTELKSIYPNLVRAAAKVRDPIKKHKEILYSLGNIQFISFAKSGKFGADLYSEYVSLVLRSDLYAETWLHDDRLPSCCNETFKVMNVAVVSIPSAKCEFGNYHDHSKYAISANYGQSLWVCIGDINRASTQYQRGGGTVCIENKDLWYAYHIMIKSVEKCH